MLLKYLNFASQIKTVKAKMGRYSFLHQIDNSYLDNLYKDFQENPDSVDQSWRKFFEGFEFGVSGNGKANTAHGNMEKEFHVAALILGYRSRGHLLSDTNPIRQRKDRQPRLNLEDHDLTEADLEQEFAAGELIGLGRAKLSAIIDKLKKLYTQTIGVEYMHINNTEVREWFRDTFESTAAEFNFDFDKKKRILGKLNEAVVFESFLSKKYVGQKRFSLEGGENTIPALDAIINLGAEQGANEFVIGMAHRGRLNVLANTLGKTYEYIFSEFEGIVEPDMTMGDGDVKYHLGFTSQVTTCNGRKVMLKLMPNPSHLEAVDAVVEGFAKAKIEHFYNGDKNSVVPILLHGDAALAGQGVVYEVAQMSRLKGFATGGTIHFVINNQIGFTTDFDDARSSTYSTGVGQVVDSPVIHVNGDDAEAVVYAVELATQFRQKFNHDVYIDMVCYRKHGHNESDEPKFTQPQLYNLINQHANPREIYIEQLVKSGEIEKKLAKNMEKEFRELLQARLNMVKEQGSTFKVQPLEEDWKSLRKAQDADFDESPETAADKKSLQKVLDALTIIPEEFHPIKKVEKLVEERKKSYEEGILDWASAELAAFGTLMLEGKNVRMSGQDVIRGTFSQRHSEIRDEKTSEGYNFLNNMPGVQGKMRIYNSLLSEFAVVGFEYGYSLVNPNTLTIWEAQFGDFANGAQVIIDQYISSGESKWQKMSGLTMLLPHGYEGQGPEHSNARPERFLQLCAENNMIVANCTTPANYFHLLRRQLAWNFRKPLIVFTPKSLLRHPVARSKVSELTSGKFSEVIFDDYAGKKVKRIIFCTGKVYYDLQEKREAEKIKDIAIVRLEQLYPFPKKQLQQVIDKYKNAECVWVQEEPQNMGAWHFILAQDMPWKIGVIGRKPSASPATGYNKVHHREQENIVNKALMIEQKKQ